MRDAQRTPARPRGFTLVELMVALAITSVIVALVTSVFVMLARQRQRRELVLEIQRWARMGMAAAETDMRSGALGAPTGIVWVSKGGARVPRPAVQVFDGVQGIDGGGWLDAKPGTDAILIVRAEVEPKVALVNNTTTTQSFQITDATGFVVNDPILIGEYADAAWLPVTTIDTNTLTTGQNVLPGKNANRVTAGALVRRARARLYFVDSQDELVRLSLNVPYPPATPADATERVVLARGVENLQAGCEVDSGAGFGACPATFTGDAAGIAGEAALAFGSFGTGGGPRLTAGVDGTGGNVGTVRTITARLSIRSPRPLIDPTGGDQKIALSTDEYGNPVTLPVGGQPDDDNMTAYYRRAYQISVGVRNTSLGVY